MSKENPPPKPDPIDGILSISVWRKLDDPKIIYNDDTNKMPAPICIAMVNRIDLLGTMAKTFYSSTIKETIIFTSRVAIQRLPRGKRAQLELPNDLPFDMFVYVRTDGLACSIIANPDYPIRTIFGLCMDVAALFDQPNVKDKIAVTTEDKFFELPKMKEMIDKFQKPDQDSIQRVQAQVEDVKNVMRQNIEQVLSNMESLESLAAKSEDLEESSKQFFEKSEKANSCRRRWGCTIM